MAEDPRDRPSDPPALAGTATVTDPEFARFLRPQPPPEVPPRSVYTPLPGLLARSLLGDRVIKS